VKWWIFCCGCTAIASSISGAQIFITPIKRILETIHQSISDRSDIPRSFEPRVARIASSISDAQIFITPIERILETIHQSISGRSDIHGLIRVKRGKNCVTDIWRSDIRHSDRADFGNDPLIDI
jgi:hypothetical protein